MSKDKRNVSLVSVVASAVTFKVTLSVVPTTKLPVRDTPPISAEDTPVIV